MSVNRRDLVRHLEQYGFFLQREGGNHSIYSSGRGKMVQVKRHTTFERMVPHVSSGTGQGG